jgi:hypothetical protein
MRIIIFTLFLVTVVANALEPPESYVVEPHLRGATTELDEERELFSGSLGAQVLSFSLSAAAGPDQFCFDYRAYCLGQASLSLLLDAETETSGNVEESAFSEEYLWFTTACEAYAEAFARSCSFTDVKGKVNVATTVTGTDKTVSMSVTVSAAAMTIAMAKSKAVAKAYADVGAFSYTNINALCSQVSQMSPLCTGGTAQTDLFQVATAKAKAKGQASSLAASGAWSGGDAQIWVAGKSFSLVYGMVTAYAQAWAFASAEAAAKAFAEATTYVYNDSFAQVCAAEFGRICAENADQELCNSTPEEACAAAWAYGEGNAEALSLACAKAFIASYADTGIYLSMSAEVDCSSAPKMIWQVAKAGAEQLCTISA